MCHENIKENSIQGHHPTPLGICFAIMEPIHFAAHKLGLCLGWKGGRGGRGGREGGRDGGGREGREG